MTDEKFILFYHLWTAVPINEFDFLLNLFNSTIYCNSHCLVYLILMIEYSDWRRCLFINKFKFVWNSRGLDVDFNIRMFGLVLKIMKLRKQVLSFQFGSKIYNNLFCFNRL